MDWFLCPGEGKINDIVLNRGRQPVRCDKDLSLFSAVNIGKSKGEDAFVLFLQIEKRSPHLTCLRMPRSNITFLLALLITNRKNVCKKKHVSIIIMVRDCALNNYLEGGGVLRLIGGGLNLNQSAG